MIQKTDGRGDATLQLGYRQERELRIRRDANWLLLNGALLRAGIPPADADSRALDLLSRSDPGVVSAVVRWLEARGLGAPAPAPEEAAPLHVHAPIGRPRAAAAPAADPRLGYQVEAC
ncbi:hypothetical protein [Phaeacidiphilus oryzae]|uniref:hypothetical protein n=1 Tax=Phaeacidiphilus oryzae TaxID=348818 RepID=UPI0005631E24|nr:hypothetical protein [Phaeacidiphilus oryzae]